MSFPEGLGWLLLHFFRGLALWVVIPSAFLAWLLVHSWAQKASLKQALAWYDANLIAALSNGPFRWLMRREARPSFVRMSGMSTISTQRIPWFDVSALFDLN
ncbi:hypothetical protein GCM10009651_18650 [Microbacterium natoriense]|uniref:hypothetical protein n=1 Tax=Microbacterium natoriense TaxID=284570 RepID=UPI0031CFA27C